VTSTESVTTTSSAQTCTRVGSPFKCCSYVIGHSSYQSNYRKPIHCTKCKSSVEVKSHFVNLKGYLQGKGELDSFQVDRTDTEMCEIFGVPVEQSEEENSDINEDN